MPKQRDRLSRWKEANASADAGTGKASDQTLHDAASNSSSPGLHATEIRSTEQRPAENAADKIAVGVDDPLQPTSDFSSVKASVSPAATGFDFCTETGQRVRIAGLVQNPVYNGTPGTVVGKEQNGRFAIELHDGNKISVKEENLEPWPGGDGENELERPEMERTSLKDHWTMIVRQRQ